MLKQQKKNQSRATPIVAIAVMLCAFSSTAGAVCTPGNNPIANARAARIDAEQTAIDQSRTAAQQQNQATASCQVAMNSDIIKTAIPDALNGIASIVKAFDPAKILGGIGTAVGSMVSQEAACKVVNNVTNSAVRSAKNIGTGAANAAIGTALSTSVSTANGAVGAVNGIAGNTGAGVYLPSVTTPTVPNSAAPGASFFDSLACKVFSRC